MIRKELCAIAGMKIPTFNSHRTNGDLPFKVDQSEAEDVSGRSWSNFTIDDAARMLAARHLVNAHGVTWSEAARMLREPHVDCGDAGPGQEYFDVDGIFVSEVRFADAQTNETPTLFQASRLYEGSLNRIVRAAQEAVEGYNADELHSGIGRKICITSLVSVDLSHHYRLTIARAKELGIDLGTYEYVPDPDGDA